MKFNKGFLAVACMTLLAVGAVAAVVSNKEVTPSFFASEVKAATRTGLFTQDTQGAHLPGNAVYFIPESTVSWWKSGADTRVYFANSDDSKYAFSEVLTYSYDRGNDSNKPVYEALVPDFPAESGLTAWTKFEVVRVQTGKIPSSISDTSVIYNYSGSCNIFYDESYHNMIGYWQGNFGEGDRHNYCELLTAVERLEILSWAQEWSKPAGASTWCKSDGSTDTSTLSAQWTASKNSFDQFGADVKYVFSTQAAEADAEEDNTQASVPDFAARYDWIFNRYSASLSLTNWADRTTL